MKALQAMETLEPSPSTRRPHSGAGRPCAATWRRHACAAAGVRLPARTLPIRQRTTGQAATSLRESSPSLLEVPTSQQVMRVMAVTDLHVDYDQNMAWCHNISQREHKRDVLIVAGDVCDELAPMEEALASLAARFAHVFYVVGNHELWIREKDREAGISDSVTKLRRLLELCHRLGVHTAPRQLGSLWVVPLFSWHHASFDREPDIPGVPPVSAWTVADYSACQWPGVVPGGDRNGSLELAAWFDRLNDTPAWRRLLTCRQRHDVISFSHFLPRQELLPEKRYLFYPNLTKAVGSAPLAARLAQLEPDIHVFGHTHFAWDCTLGGTRYIQAPLCSPVERQRRIFTVGFGASMEQAEADPLGAAWLPLLVYQGAAPAPPAAAEGSDAEDAAAGEAQQEQQAAAATADEEGQPGTVISQQLPAASGSRLAAPDRHSALFDHEVALEKQLEEEEQRRQSQQQQHEQQSQEEQRQQQQAAARQASRQNRQHHGQLALPGEGVPPWVLEPWVQQGWQPLRHGVAAPPLRAHWSSYYATHARQPEDLTLAPWVAKLYERRSRRAAEKGAGQSSQDGGSSSSDGEGQGGSGGSTALDGSSATYDEMD